MPSRKPKKPLLLDQEVFLFGSLGSCLREWRETCVCSFPERLFRIASATCTFNLKDRFLTLFMIICSFFRLVSPHTVSKVRPESENKVLRNREAAQQFRQRQREHILVLQAEHDKLVLENRAYQEHMSRLRLQREDLDRDINYARSFLEHTMSIAMANLRHSNRLDQLEPVMAHA